VTVQVEKVEAALASLRAGELADAAKVLGTMVRAKRHVRPSASNAAPEEIDEVERWLVTVLADPGDGEADDLIARAYYKLRSQMPA
jgi:LmbE family N-acetylglucosaminyl deacetylase